MTMHNNDLAHLRKIQTTEMNSTFQLKLKKKKRIAQKEKKKEYNLMSNQFTASN